MEDFKLRVVCEARKWLGTAFHHQGRVRRSEQHKGGCDCIGLVIEVARTLQIKSRRPIKNGRHLLLAEADKTGYSRIPDGLLLQQQLETHCYLVDTADIACGDVLLFKFADNPQHVALVSDYEHGLGIIHAYAQTRKVVEHRLDAVWFERIVAAYRFEGI
jgi:cell wall-associated NlpC family hydrolase